MNNPNLNFNRSVRDRGCDQEQAGRFRLLPPQALFEVPHHSPHHSQRHQALALRTRCGLSGRPGRGGMLRPPPTRQHVICLCPTPWDIEGEEAPSPW